MANFRLPTDCFGAALLTKPGSTRRRLPSRRVFKPFIVAWAILLPLKPALAIPQSEQARIASQDIATFPASGAPTSALPSTVPHESQPTVKGLAGDILRDQGYLWLRPFRVRRTDLPWDAAIIGGTAGLMAIDRRVGQSLSANPPGTGYDVSRVIGFVGDPLSDAAIAGGMYVAGRWRGSEHERATGLLAFRAIVDSQIVAELLKLATQRPRPTTSGGRVRIDNAQGEFFWGGNSFPSGHAAGAWAFAAVVVERYPGRRWLEPTAFGLAGLVSVSRLTERRHFPSDVFVGAAFGYLIGRHVAQTPNPRTEDKLRKWLPQLKASGGRALRLGWEF